MAAAAGIIYGWAEWDRREVDAQPISDWMQVNKIDVADGVVGEDLKVVYDRTIKQDFTIVWRVEVLDVIANAAVCTGSGINEVRKDAAARAEPSITLSRLVGKDCKLGIGEYVLQANWVIKPEGYSDKREKLISNIFKVFPSDSAEQATGQPQLP
jgi:hypothetical protein